MTRGRPRDPASPTPTDPAPTTVDAVPWGETLPDSVPAPTLAHPLAHAVATDGRREHAVEADPDDEVLRVPEAERYEEGERLGAGGMGEVRLCRDRRLGRDVAHKRLRLGAEAPADTRLRFLREVRIQGGLEHPAIVPVYDLGAEADGGPYFTMRRIRGMTLHDVLRGLAAKTPEVVERYSRRKLLTAMVSVCLAIHYAHTRGVLHRDLKPANIMFGDFGEVYVIDWGIAKVVGDPAEGAHPADVRRSVTGMNDVVGTAGYMAPEQFAGRLDALDARADVYALGAMLFEVLALRPLLGARTLADALDATLRGVDARASEVAPDVAPELDAIVVRATALDPNDRFPTARAMADAIERFLDGERDLAARRAQADRHAARAARAPTRAEAMRAVLAALALDPDHADARRTLLKLLTDVPDALPPEAEAQAEAQARHARVEVARLGWRAYLSWLACLPLVYLLGVRRPALVGVGAALLAAASAHAYWVWRTRTTTTRHAVAMLVVSSAVVALFAGWLGPFILLPTAAALNTLFYATYADGRERPVVLAMGALSVLAPLGAELAGWLPRSFVFRDGALVLLPRLVDIPPTLTLVSLAYTAVAFVVLPSLLFGSVREALRAAERKLLLHAWHLRQLLPDEAREADAKGG